MAFDQPTRNRLLKFVGYARELLVREFTRQLQHEYGMDPQTGKVSELEQLVQLDDNRRETARLLRDTLEHYLAGSPSRDIKECMNRIVREQSFTVLNRLCALRMCESRGMLIQSIANGYKSKGFQLYARLAGTALGETGDAYRCYLHSIFDEFALDLAILFDRYSPQGRLFPRESTLLELLNLINDPDIESLWREDETIGWVYQYFNTAEERRQMRAESMAPRNSRELAVRNQFFTPRYVVEFLTDNTLGRIWYEMTRGNTALIDRCQYLVRRPNEVFLAEGEEAPEQEIPNEDLTQEELLKQPVYISHRPLKDPREILMLDPACGSMHFGLYAFDLFEKIYEEAWELEIQFGAGVFARSEKLKPLRDTYEDQDKFFREIPRLIIEHNIHGIDIDPRAVQIAGLSLWLRAHRSWQDQGIKPQDRLQVRKSNVVCAEPMPGDKEMLREFTANLQPRVLGQLVDVIFDKMQLAGEAGALLKIEAEIEAAIAQAREGFNKEILRRKAEKGYLPGMAPKYQPTLFNFADLPNGTKFWEDAEERIFNTIQDYALRAEGERASRKYLFARDAIKGFVFLDICHKRYDVVLMNPPFGQLATPTKHYNAINYTEYRNDIYSIFIVRGVEMLNYRGKLGAITASTYLNLASFEDFRRYLIEDVSVKILLELGMGVMDDAVVLAACIVLSSGYPNDRTTTIFSNFVKSSSAESDLTKFVMDINDSIVSLQTHIHFISSFRNLPQKMFSYWIPKSLFELFNTLRPIAEQAVCTVGLHTRGNEVRFYRLWWEPTPNLKFINDWPVVKVGGNPQHFYRESYVVVNWSSKAAELNVIASKASGGTFTGSGYYFKRGLTYIYTGQKTFSVQPLEEGSVFSIAAPAIFLQNESELFAFLGILNSEPVRLLLKVINPNRFFQAAYVKLLPLPNFSHFIMELSSLALKSVLEARSNSMGDECSRFFVSEWTNEFKSYNQSPFEATLKLAHNKAKLLASWKREVDEIICKTYGILPIEVKYLQKWIGASTAQALPGEDSIITSGKHFIASSLISYGIGCVFGRWDVRIALNPTLAPKLPKPFDAIPSIPPGMLVGQNGLPAKTGGIVSEEWLKARADTDSLPTEVRMPTISDSEYPLRISWNGILVDDEGHPLDIVLNVREYLEIVWENKAANIEHEACEIIGIKILRDYFSKPGNFFAEHLKRYSKSHRQAPIFLPLSTAFGSYTLWLYYHRVTDQTLYICVNDFVEPKMKQTSEAVNQLSQKKGRNKQEEKELERLSDREQELKDFRNELLRIAAFWKPNLNDGVQITAAPLWNFFRHAPWHKTLKQTWQKLEKGEYDWAHLAYGIWPERVREKCKKDKSLAIAHGLEELYQEPGTQKKKSGTRRGRKK